jgi:hypothetical protein
MWQIFFWGASLLRYFFLFVIISSSAEAKFFDKVNLHAAGGFDAWENSHFKALLESGELDLKSEVYGSVGAGYYFEGINTEINFSITDYTPKSEAVSSDVVNFHSRMLGLDYFFNGIFEETSYFTGLAFGKTKVSVGDDKPSDSGGVWRIRAGHQWRLRRLLSVIVYASYQKTEDILVKQFYYFGSSAEVSYESISAFAGIRVYML